MICFFSFFNKKRPIKRDQITVWSIKNSNLYNNFDLIWSVFNNYMFSFYWNRNCVNVHWEIQSNKGWTFFCHITLGPFLMGQESNIHRELFLSCVFLWIFSALWNPKFLIVNGYRRAHSSGPDFPIRLRFTGHFNVWKMSKKDWITSLLLDPPPMLPKKKWILLPKKVIGNEKNPQRTAKRKSSRKGRFIVRGSCRWAHIARKRN